MLTDNRQENFNSDFLIISGDLLASLHKAVRFKKWRLVRLLLENGSYTINGGTQVAQTSKVKEDSALFLALKLPFFDSHSEERLKFVQFLLVEDKLDVNERNADSTTPLIVACIRSLDIELISFLMSQGANHLVTDNFGMNAFDYAMEKNRLDIVQLMQAIALHGANKTHSTLARKSSEEGNGNSNAYHHNLLASNRTSNTSPLVPPGTTGAIVLPQISGNRGKQLKRSLTCNALTLTAINVGILDISQKFEETKNTTKKLQKIISEDEIDGENTAQEEQSGISSTSSSVAQLLRQGFARHQNIVRLHKEQLSNSSSELSRKVAESDEEALARNRQFNLDIIRQALTEMEKAVIQSPVIRKNLCDALPLSIRQDLRTHKNKLRKSVSQLSSPQLPIRQFNFDSTLLSPRSKNASQEHLVIDISEKQTTKLSDVCPPSWHFVERYPINESTGLLGPDGRLIKRQGSSVKLNDHISQLRPGVLPPLNIGTKPVVPSIPSPRFERAELSSSNTLTSNEKLSRRRQIFASKRSVSMAERMFPSFPISGVLVDRNKDVLKDSFQQGISDKNI